MPMLQEQNKRYQSSSGVSISYHISRCPDASCSLILLHGLASNHTRWTEFINNTKLAQTMNLLRLDLRGHGESMTRGRINHSIWQQDLYEILQQESLDTIIIVGHSMGAQLALHYTLAQPTQVRGLVLIDPTIPERLKGRLALARRFRYPLIMLVALYRIFCSLNPFPKTYPQRDLYELDKKTRQLMLKQSTDVIAELYTSPSQDLKYIPLVNYLQDVLANISPLPDVSTIRCPVQLLLSQSSTIVESDNIQEIFPKETVIDITEIDANHWPLTEKPEETRQSIDEWCLKVINKRGEGT